MTAAKPILPSTRPIGDDAEVVEVGQPPLFSSVLVRIDFGKVSDRGKKRSNNEDKRLVAHLRPRSRVLADESPRKRCAECPPRGATSGRALGRRFFVSESETALVGKLGHEDTSLQRTAPSPIQLVTPKGMSQGVRRYRVRDFG